MKVSRDSTGYSKKYGVPIRAAITELLCKPLKSDYSPPFRTLPAGERFTACGVSRKFHRVFARLPAEIWRIN